MIASLPLPSIYLPTEGNGPYPYDRRMVLQLQAHELALIDRLRARGTKTPKHRPKQTISIVGPLVRLSPVSKSINVYPDVEPLVYRLRPLAWRFALSFQSYGFLSPSSCWTDPLYLSFLSECFSKPSFFQNLLRSSFFLRTQGKEDEPYYCKTQKIEQKKYSLTEGAKRKRGLALASLGVIYFLVAQHMYSLPAYAFIAQDFTTQAALYTNLFIRCLRNRPQPLKYVVRGVAYSIQAISLRGLWNERKAGTKRDFNGDFPVVPAMRLLCCLTRKRERSSGLN
ncbi:hypothetical protein L1987_87987 [Smallanthus sonchifolius]|nr:hypothetical protein L1987_89774 [Smallanthus sonchifolius]KAI3664484.1 hypothetical protein L1987_89760 [Smallanthus sonchifolius]KAI3664663.1 hypothetical protein L1987_89572 [Smallanthus sonchifolius]KAI3666097.1 hypothetical protein L1987_89415 [Smallanthus sonchifolius]KAI3666514.1 hypothetical protein L1987_88972 [Smallanthus sonchifolius]